MVIAPVYCPFHSNFNTCLHRQEKKSVIAPFRDSTTFIDIFDQYHDYKLKNNEFTVKAKGETVIAPTLTVVVLGEMIFVVSVLTIMQQLIWNSERNLKLYCHYVIHARLKAKIQWSQDHFKCVQISQPQSQRTESIKINGLNTGTSTLKSSVCVHECYKNNFLIALYFSSIHILILQRCIRHVHVVAH